MNLKNRHVILRLKGIHVHTIMYIHMCTHTCMYIVHVHVVYVHVHVCDVSHLEYSKKLQVLRDSESVKEHIMLWTYSEAVSDLVHVAPDVITIDDCCTSRGGVQT